MGLDQGVTDQYPVLMRDKNLLLGQDHAANPVGRAGYALAVEFSYVLVAFRTVHTAFVAVQPQVERCPMLDDRFVERRQHHVTAVAQFRNGVTSRPCCLRVLQSTIVVQ